MAKQIIVDFTVKTGAATREVDDLKKEIQGLNKEVQNTNEQTEKGLKGVEKASATTAGGVKKIGTALKALGIGLILAAFAKLTEAFGRNQRVADKFNIAFEATSIVFQDFINFVLDNVGSVKSSFDSIFSDPLQSLKNLGNAIKNNILERFNSMLETIGFAGSAIKKFFKGDFAGAAEDAKSAGKELVDVYTGVDGTVDKTIDTFKKIKEETVEYSKSVLATATSLVELEKASRLAAAQNRILLEQFDRESESLRQVRDDTTLSIAKRIEANDNLKKTLEEQAKVMKRNAEIEVSAARLALKGNEDNIDAQVRLKDAIAEKAAIEAQVTGFMSEQKINEIALNKELTDSENTKIESAANLSIEQKRFNAEQIEDNLQRLNKQKEIDAEEQEMQSNRLQAIIDEAADGTQAKIDAQIALDEFMEQSRQTNFKRKKEIEDEEARIEKENSDTKVAVAKAEADAKDKIFAQTEKALGQLSGIAGEETKAGKAFAVAAATINTYRGVSDALAATTVTPFETALKFINAAAILSNGLKNVKSILAVKIPQTSVGGRMSGGGGVGGGGAVPQAPSFNIVGSDPQNQLAQTLAQQTNQPVKAYVVSGDVTTAQSLDRNIVQESSLG
tara:strand:+ start:279 stop:2135 length:1857 start_codon:yes stop_codon:yes gene_type:complete